jgi:hypothetical protein
MKEMEKQTIYRYTYIGGNYETKVEEIGGGSGETLDHKVLVRGHWRHQWTGRQRDEEGNRIPGTSQKLIWIEPYWKGPDVQDGKTTIRGGALGVGCVVEPLAKSGTVCSRVEKR